MFHIYDLIALWKSAYFQASSFWSRTSQKLFTELGTAKALWCLTCVVMCRYLVHLEVIHSALWCLMVFAMRWSEGAQQGRGWQRFCEHVAPAVAEASWPPGSASASCKDTGLQCPSPAVSAQPVCGQMEAVSRNPRSKLNSHVSIFPQSRAEAVA